MLFGVVITVSLIGAIVLGIGLVLQRGRASIDLSPRSLLRFYLYFASLAGVIALSGGLAALLTFGLSGPLGRDVMYGAVPQLPAEPTPACAPGAADCAKGPLTSEEQRSRALAERDRRASEDLIRGISFTIFGAIFFGAHWLARRSIVLAEQSSLLHRSYLMLVTLAFGLATIFLLPSGVATAASSLVLTAPADSYRESAGAELSGGLVALVLWLAYLRLVVRDFRAPAA